MINLNLVKEILNMGGLALPYPRLKRISINGSRGEPATPEAIKYAQSYYKTKDIMDKIEKLYKEIDDIEYMLTICNDLAYKDYKELLNDKNNELLELTLLHSFKQHNMEALQWITYSKTF